MTRIILNLGLDAPVFGKPAVNYDANYLSRLYLSRIPEILQDGIGWDRQGDTMIAWGRLIRGQGCWNINRLCIEARQDCFAAWFPDLNVGNLYGPRASEWGAFDLGQFKFPSMTLTNTPLIVLLEGRWGYWPRGAPHQLRLAASHYCKMKNSAEGRL